MDGFDQRNSGGWGWMNGKEKEDRTLITGKKGTKEKGDALRPR